MLEQLEDSLELFKGQQKFTPLLVHYQKELQLYNQLQQQSPCRTPCQFTTSHAIREPTTLPLFLLGGQEKRVEEYGILEGGILGTPIMLCETEQALHISAKKQQVPTSFSDEILVNSNTLRWNYSVFSLQTS